MLSLWRRHLRSCVFANKVSPRKYVKCNCPIWVQGTLRGSWMKKSLGIRNWESAQRLVRDWEAGTQATIPMNDACERFHADAVARKLGQAQLGKYRLLVGELKQWFGEKVVSSVTVDDLREYRESWDLSPVSALKKLERVRTFFRFCVESGWIGNNPARLLRPPKVKPKPTLPFTDEEIEKILWACEVYQDRPKGRRAEIRAFVLLLRYSGLRIRDAVTLKRRDVVQGRLLLYTAKTGSGVYVPLPDVVLEALGKIQKADVNYFFWSGHGNPKSAVADWQRSLKRLFGLAGVQGHAHRFRDSFAVSLLQRGVSLENVAVLLGHQSIKVTEKHYAPWVKSRQENLEREVRKAWPQLPRASGSKHEQSGHTRNAKIRRG
jgi:integrase/recombinase XerD